MPTIFDRFRSALSNQRTPAKPFSEQGVAGFAAFGGYVHVPEKNPDVTGPNRWHTAADLLTNVSIIAASVRYTLNLISHPRWKANPPSDKQEAKDLAEFVEEVINGADTSWSRIVRRAGVFRYHGFGVHEWVAKKREDGRIGIQSIEVRPVHTITKWDVDENGGVLGVVQVSPQTGQEIYLPRPKLVYLVDDALTDRPDGMGWFRHLAEPTQRLRKYLKLETIGFERDLSGIPVGYAPIQRINQLVADAKLTQAQATEMLDALKNFVTLKSKESNTGAVFDSEPYMTRTSDGETVSAVKQWGLELITGEPKSVEQLGNAIKRLETDMALIMGTESMLVGRDGQGSRALSEDKSRNLYLTSNAALSDMAEAFDRDIVTMLWTLNGLPDELRPKLETEDVAFKDAEQVARTLAEMAQAGAILHPNDPAINDVRNLLGISEQEELDDATVGLMLGAPQVDPNKAPDQTGRPSRENPDKGPKGDPPGGPKPGRGQAAKYDPNQPRDEDGKWTDGGGGVAELTKAEHEAVVGYSTSTYHPINKALRAGDQGDWSKDIEHLDSAIAGEHAGDELTVYRGLHISNTQVDDLPVGSVVSDAAYASTSRSHEVGLNFAVTSGQGGGEGAALLRIKVPKGSNALDVNRALGKIAYEREVILPRGQKMRVTRAARSENFTVFDRPRAVTVIDVEVVG